MSIKNIDSLRQKLQKIKRNVRTQTFSGVVVAAEHLKNEMVETLHNGEKSGKLYKRGNKTHRASAPGEAPATDTGQLARSIRNVYSRSQISATVGPRSNAPYAKSLEFGTSKMAARPFVRPTFNKNKEKIKKIIEVEAKKGVKNGI